MKKIILIPLFIVIYSFAFSQIKQTITEPVKWNAKYSQKATGERVITLQANIDPDWYIYAITESENGPLPLEISLKEENKIAEIYDIKEFSKSEEIFDNVFNTNVYKYDNEALLKLSIKLNSPVNKVHINIDGQACNKKNGTCIQIKETIPVEINNDLK